MRFVRTPAVSHEPLHAMNTTPLIDVLLVLLIMLILTIPVATHKIAVDLPTPHGEAHPETAHQLAISADGSLAWDGRAIRDAELPGLLAAMQREGAVLHMNTDPEARYERFDGVLAVVKDAGVERLGFVGNRPFD